MRYVISILIFLIPLVSFAQNFEEDARKIREAYSKINKLDAELQVNIYENKLSTKPIEIKTVTFKKSNDLYLYKMEGVIMLMNEKCRLMVNTTDKQMLYSKRNLKEEKALLKEVTPDINELGTQKDSIKYSGIENGSKHYILYSSDKMIQRTDLYIDTKTGLVAKLVYYYNTELFPVGNKVVIHYKRFDLAPSFSPATFSESPYVQGSRKAMKPAAAYNGYHLVMQDDNEWDKIQ